jgi:TolB-like protein/tetratricopeptide (TPR) repeat protein
LADVFVSYARRDHARVAPLVAALEAEGWSVWWDPEIAPGEEFDALIAGALESARSVLVVWTPNSVGSRWVRGEARDASDRGVLVPVRFENAKLPIDFRAVHTIDLDDWNEDPGSDAFQSVRRALAAMVDASPGRHGAGSMARPSRTRAVPAGSALKRRVGILFVAMLAFGIGAMLVKSYSPLPGSTPTPGEVAGTSTAELPVPADRSIAVLPFSDLSPAGDNAYFSDGLSEALMDSLAKIPGLTVASRTSSFAFRNSGPSVPEVASALQVANLLEGSVRKSGNQLKISARLLDGRSGRPLWSETFDATTEDIFSVQETISVSIADALKIRLLGSETLVEVPTRDQQAYEDYLRGREQLRREGTAANLEQAIAYFEQALARDPQMSLALAGICTARWEKYSLTRDRALADEAIEACMYAQGAADSSVEVKVALGNLYRGIGDLPYSLSLFQAALELSPNDAEVSAGLGNTLREMGDLEEAARMQRRAIELDPAFWRNYWNLGATLVEQGQLEPAAEEFRRAIRLKPDSPTPYYSLGGVYWLQGEFLQAADAFRESIRRDPEQMYAYSNAGTLYFYTAEFAQAEEMFLQAARLSPSDDRFQGYVAEAIVMQEGRDPADAKMHYEAALELAQRRLDVNSGDHAARARVAGYLARLGRDQESRDVLEVLWNTDELSLEAIREMGMVCLFLGERERAVERLSVAREAGLPAWLLTADKRLEALADLPGFQALLDGNAQ